MASDPVDSLIEEMWLKFEFTTNDYIHKSFSPHLTALKRHFPFIELKALQAIVLSAASAIDFSAARPAAEVADDIVDALRSPLSTLPEQQLRLGLGEVVVFRHPSAELVGRLVKARIEYYADDTVLRIQRNHPDVNPHPTADEARESRRAAARCSKASLAIAQCERELGEWVEREKARLRGLVGAENPGEAERLEDYIEAAECYLRVVYDVFPKAVIEVRTRMDGQEEKTRLAYRWEEAKNALWKRAVPGRVE